MCWESWFVRSALLALAVFLRQRTRALLSGDGWQRHLRVLIDDLNLIGHSRYLYFAFLQSLPYLLLQGNTNLRGDAGVRNSITSFQPTLSVASR